MIHLALWVASALFLLVLGLMALGFLAPLLGAFFRLLATPLSDLFARGDTRKRRRIERLETQRSMAKVDREEATAKVAQAERDLAKIRDAQ